jgi:hypothetical protein
MLDLKCSPLILYISCVEIVGLMLIKIQMVNYPSSVGCIMSRSEVYITLTLFSCFAATELIS